MTGSGQRHCARFSRERHGLAGDDRLHSPTFARNAPPIIAALCHYLRERSGPVLEIGAGTGQHAASFALAFPTLDWIASDLFPEHRASIRAWARDLLGADRAALDIDAAGDWATQAAVQALGPLTGVYAGNITHIAPWEVTLGILAGAGRTLSQDGRLFLYGPFRDGDDFFGDGNRNFDRGLRADNHGWGLRDIGELRMAAGLEGLRLEAGIMMPANNHLLVFGRR
jgi:hypothetical protein